MRPRGFGYLVEVLLVAAAYAACARLGAGLATPPDVVSVIAPAAGLAVAAVALLGLQVWPGVWLGAFANAWLLTHGDVLGDATAMALGVGVATGATLAAIAGVGFARLVQGRGPRIETPRDVLAWTVGAGCVAATVSATIGTAMYGIAELLPAASAPAWRTWWVGDASAVTLLVPPALLWTRLGRLRFRPGQETETLVATLAFALLCTAVFGTRGPEAFAPYLLALPLLFLSYTALRFGRRITATSAVAIAVLAVGATLSSSGPLLTPERGSALFDLALFLDTGAILGLLLASAAVQTRSEDATPSATIPPETGAFPLESLVPFRPAAAPAEPPPTPDPPAPAPELALDAVLAALPEPVYLLSRQTLTITRCNAAFAAALAAPAPDLMDGRSLFDVFPPAAAMAAADHARRVFQTEQNEETREEWSGRIWTVVRSPVRGADGSVVALIARARPAAD